MTSFLLCHRCFMVW